MNRKHFSILLILLFTQTSFSQESGAVRFLSNYVSPSGGAYTSGCWGWTDTTTGREYALLGNQCGTSIVEITNPLAPIERDFIPGVCSIWREIQVHSHYAYVVSEGGGGVQIIDLSTLPDSAHLVGNFIYTQGPMNTQRSHSIHIKDGYMYLNGCGFWPPGGIVIFSLADPVNPVFQSAYTRNYIHDCFVRNDTIYAAAIGGVGIDFIDITTKTNPVYLYTLSYANSASHNCATTNDGQHLLTTDETSGGHLKIWNIATPPTFPLVAEYIGDPASIVHNVFVKGNLGFMSYYTAGLKVVDITDPTNPVEIGGYDTYQGSSGGFTGAWSTYPFFPSGRVIIGDMVSGLYVVEVDTNAPRTPTSFSAHSDYTTPTSIQLQWTYPTTFINGDTLTNFHIHLYRNGAFAAVVDSGVEMYADTGLTTHQLYHYSIRAVIPLDSSSVVSASAYAGGHAQPRPPTNFAIVDGTDGAHLSWKNPSAQLDGTPLNDLAYIDIFWDGVLYDSMAQGFADTGQVRTYLDSTIGYHMYRIRARDNETPEHASTFTDSLLGYGGIGYSYLENFESGRGTGYVRGTWDTTQRIAYTGIASLTDSPIGRYPNNSTTYYLTPPVIVGANMELTFTHIAIILTGGDSGVVEISTNNNRTFSRLGSYNFLLHSEWQDTTADPGDWFTETFSLASYAGDTVSIRFRLRSSILINADGWYVDDISINTATDVKEGSDGEIPTSYVLEQNYPNPFNPTTSIKYSLPVSAAVRLRIFNIVGEEVAALVQAEQPAGRFEVVWNGKNNQNEPVSSGMYIYRLEAIPTSRDGSHFIQQRKMILVK